MSERSEYAPHKAAPASLCYATVRKVRRLGQVTKVVVRRIFGTAALLVAALSASQVSEAVNVSFLERENLNGRHHNVRKRRKT